MANHGWVKTKKNISPQVISDILSDLNNRLFKGNLVVEYFKSTKDDCNYGDEHTWVVKYVSDSTEWISRACWLVGKRKFELRHGGGSKLAWWIDTAILNEVAVKYGALVCDDGVEDKVKGVPNKYDTFKSYLSCFSPCVSKLELEFTPKEFHDQF